MLGSEVIRNPRLHSLTAEWARLSIVQCDSPVGVSMSGYCELAAVKVGRAPYDVVRRNTVACILALSG